MKDAIYDQRADTYGTAGIEHYHAKNRALGNAALEPKDSGMASAVIGDLDRLLHALGEINARQVAQLERLFGAPNLGSGIAGSGTGKPAGGSLSLIAEMLRETRERVEQIAANQKQLEQVG